MKKLLKLICITLVLALCLSLTACSSYGKIEKALSGIGYTVIETNSTGEKMQEESEVAVNVHFMSNAESLSALEIAKLTNVIIIEFNKTDDMLEFYNESDTLKGLVSDVKKDGTAEEFYNSLVDNGYAKGNCLVLAIGLDYKNVNSAVKNA